MANNKNNRDNLKNFKKGISGNPKGRPKKLVSFILDELKNEGELVTRSMVEQTYQVLMSLTKAKLLAIVKDDDQPMINRIVGKEMLSKKGFEVIEKMLDRANGRPTNNTKNEHSGKDGTPISISPITWVQDKKDNE